MRALTGLLFCVCAAATASFSPGQQVGPAAPPVATAPLAVRPPTPVAPPQAPRYISDPVGNGLVGSVNPSNPFYVRGRSNKAERKVSQEIQEAKRKLNSDDAATRSEAADKLNDAVGRLFDMRTATRKKQIEDLEKRLAKLRKQMEERSDKKSEIVRLHVQTMINEAKGLGF